MKKENNVLGTSSNLRNDRDFHIQNGEQKQHGRTFVLFFWGFLGFVIFIKTPTPPEKTPPFHTLCISFLSKFTLVYNSNPFFLPHD